MANSKTGFSYYSTDTDRYSDIKIKRLKKKFSGDGMAIYDYLLCEIYRGKGCYMEFDSNVAFDVAECFYKEESNVIEIVNFCAEIGLFDMKLFKTAGILTSSSIQERFLDWSKKAKRNAPEIPKHVLILLEESDIVPEVSIQLPEHSVIIEDNSVSLPQRKKVSKESKKVVGDLNITFETVWDLYGKKKGNKKYCVKTWESYTDEEREQALKKIGEYLKTLDPLDTDRKYQANLETYLRQDRWKIEEYKSIPPAISPNKETQSTPTYWHPSTNK